MSTPLRVAQSSRRLSSIAQRLHSRQQKCRSTPPQRRAKSPYGREESFLLTREEFLAPAIGRTSPTCSSTTSPSIGSSHTKYHPSRRYRSRGRYLSASILIGIDVPEERQRQVPTNQIIQRTVERTQVLVHRDMYPIIQKIQKTVEAPQEQLWTVPRILKFQETVEYATGPCQKTVCVRQVQDMDMIVDSYLCYNTKYRQS